jgi:crossover junction endodeoxyribonuclease RuvC
MRFFHKVANELMLSKPSQTKLRKHGEPFKLKVIQRRKMNLRYYIGIDPGSHVAGFACIRIPRASCHLKEIELVDLGVFRGAKAGKKLAPFLTRLNFMNKAFTSLLEEYEPEACVFENVFFGLNALSALKLGHIRGALIASAAVRNVSIIEVASTQAKKIIAGHGRATKEEVARSLETLLGRSFKGVLPDATDALALAISGALSGGSITDFSSKDYAYTNNPH